MKRKIISCKKLNKKDEKLIADLGGYYVVQMLTPQALDNESKQMQHCIGHGSYDSLLSYKEFEYLSLRDKYNKAHVTLEVLNKGILQLQGKQNRIPEQKYLERIVPWLIENKYQLDLNEYELILNISDNKIYSIYDLPENCEINGNLHFKSVNNLNNVYLPKNIKINGDILLFDMIIKQNMFPDNFLKKDKISLMDVLFFLTQNYRINLGKYDLALNKNDNKIYYKYDLPENCKIDNGLNISFLHNAYTKKVKKLPENLYINGDLNLLNLDIETIPNNLVVKDNLYIINCRFLKTIPCSIKVEKDISLFNISFKLDNLPKELIVDDKIKIFDLVNFFYKTESKFSLSKNGYILNKQDDKIYQIEDLPENCIIDGNLSLSRTHTIKLPNNLKVYGKLNLSNSEIEFLPDFLECKNLVITDKQVPLILNKIKFDYITVESDFDSTYVFYSYNEFVQKYENGYKPNLVESDILF